MVDEREFIPAQLGRVTLRPHQRTAAARLTSLISLNGGAMLAEPVGLGKTYTSLAVARALR
jgi:superfamily II DNA or RNA helicase